MVSISTHLLPSPGGRSLRQGVCAALIVWLAASVLSPRSALADAPAAGAPAGIYQLADPNLALTFDGHGWGHGVGLCQWGARGRALAGQSAEQIISAYYQGSTIQKAVAPETIIRVLLDTGRQVEAGEAPRITARGGQWQVAISGASPIQAPPDAYLELSRSDSGLRFAVKTAGGSTLGDGALAAPLVLRPLEGGTRFTIGYKPAGEVAGRPGTYYDTYRGELVLLPTESGIDTINRLSLEDYLRGVVPAEMPASWPAEALKAQTLASRTYAVWQARSRAGERYDVDDTTRYQVYLGANAERDNVNQLIDATAGQVVMYNGRIAQTYFFSTCAGWTENNEDVWTSGQPLPYLRGIHDVDGNGRPYDADAPRFSWTTGALTATQLESILNTDPATAIGHLLSLDLTRRTPSGRLIQITATGTAGSKTVAATTLMAIFNRNRPNGVAQLLSTNFDLHWTTMDAVLQTQGGTPAPIVTAPATPQSAQPTPTPLPPPSPTPVPTPTYHLEYTQPAPAKPDGPTNQYFAATGHNVGGAFLAFYQQHGGLDLFGYPRTEELLEDGMTVQYFQRARFEYHVDKAGTPYEVELALLGDTLTAPRRPFPTVGPFESSADHVYFPETGHSLSFAFLSYWREHGGLDAFGYPISEELYGENGWPYAVQYFQRARFEYHPEHAGTPYEVQLGLLGDQLLSQRLWLQ